jgi:hypothetical protein
MERELKINYKENLPFWLAGLIGLLLPSLLFYFPVATELKLVVDAEIERGSVMAIFINEDYNRSPSLPIKAGERHSYIFDNLSEKVSELRLDPTDLPEVRFKIYKISVLKNNLPIFEQSGDKIALLGMLNAVIESKNPDYVEYKSTSNDPIIHGNLSYSISWFDRLLLKIGTTPQEFALNFTWVCLGFILILGLLRWKDPAWKLLWPILLIPVFTPAEYYMSKIGLKIIHSPLPIQKSVGNSSFLGFPKAIETRTFILMVLAAILFGIGSYFFMRGKNRGVITDNQSKKFSLLFAGTICTGIFLCSFPQLKSAFDQLPITGHAPDWDSQAILNWQYVANKGLIPYKDYWFPYGGFWDMLSPFPWDLFRFHIYKFIVFGVFSVAIYIITGNRKIWTLGILFATLCFNQINYFQGLYRYALSIDVMLFYLCLLFTGTDGIKWYIYYGLFTGWVFFYEPAQIFYPALPVLTLFILDYFSDHSRSKVRKLILHLSGFCTLLVIIALYIAKLNLYGQWSGWLRFYSQMNAMTASSSTPGTLTQWSTFLLRPENIVLLGTLFFIMWGVYLVLFQKNLAQGRKYGYIVLSFGLLAMMVFLKHIVRPHMARQFIAIHFLAILLFLCAYSSRWNKLQRITGSLMFGGFIGFANQAGLLSYLYSSYITPISSLETNIKTLFIDKNKLQIQQNAFFSPDLFTKESPSAKAIYNYLSSFYGENAIPDFYVLGDDLYIYVMTGKTPPPYTSVYDGGPVEAQKTNLAWLSDHKPELVIWNSESQGFDGVPNIIRVPMLFDFVISHYKFKEKIDKFFVLEKKQPGSKTDLEFWAKNLGSTINIQHLAKGSSYPTLLKCSAPENEGCDDFLAIYIEEPVTDQAQNIELEIDGIKFTVQFTESADTHAYYIYLDRLWFWSLAVKEGLSKKVTPSQIPGVKWEIVNKLADPAVLY